MSRFHSDASSFSVHSFFISSWFEAHLGPQFCRNRREDKTTVVQNSSGSADARCRRDNDAGYAAESDDTSRIKRRNTDYFADRDLVSWSGLECKADDEGVWDCNTWWGLWFLIHVVDILFLSLISGLILIKLKRKKIEKRRMLNLKMYEQRDVTQVFLLCLIFVNKQVQWSSLFNVLSFTPSSPVRRILNQRRESRLKKRARSQGFKCCESSTSRRQQRSHMRHKMRLPDHVRSSATWLLECDW